MQSFEIPKFPVLYGEDAVQALKSYIKEIEEQTVEGLSERQTKALICVAQGLISTIENPTLCPTKKDNKDTHFLSRIETAIVGFICA